MATTHLSTAPRPHATTAWRRWGFGGLAAAWYALTTFAPLELPNVVVVPVLGLLVALSTTPDARCPTQGVVATPRNLVLAAVGVIAFIPVALGMELLVGRMPIETGHVVLATLATVCVVLPRLAQTRELPHPVVLGHRELILTVTALVAAARAYLVGEAFLALTVFAVLAPVVMAVRRIRLGADPPRGLTRPSRALQAGNTWLFLALLAAAGLSGTLYVWRVYLPGAWTVVVGAFWVGLAAAAVLVVFPRRRLSLATNALALLGSLLLSVALVATVREPADTVTIGVPSTAEWQVVNGGGSALVNSHRMLAVERDAIDLLQVVDGRTHRGDRSRLENFFVFGQPVLAVADGTVTAAVDGHPDLPVGGHVWHDMAGNHVIVDIGGGRYVLFGHLKQGSLRVQVGDGVRPVGSTPSA